ncbi:MAG: ComF family protein [Gammaproteobacteria bacterium]
MTDMPNHPSVAHHGPRRVLDSSTTDRLMVEIDPIRLAGPWHEGFALDFHTVGSQLLGYDAYGNPQFETIRTAIGELLYKLKYRSDRSTVGPLCQTAAEFVEDRGWDLNLIAPVPPSRSGRRFQPVPMLARELGRLLGWPSCPDCIIKTRVTDQLKAIYDYQERLDQLTGAYSVTTDKVMNQNVLLIDDVYRSGATLEAVANAVRNVGRARKVFALAFTRTRSNQ